MTNTNTETKPTTKGRIPGWVASFGTLLIVWGVLQAPKAYRDYQTGVRAGERTCELVGQGRSLKSAMQTVVREQGDKKVSDTWGFLMEVGGKQVLNDCEPLRRMVLRQTGMN